MLKKPAKLEEQNGIFYLGQTIFCLKLRFEYLRPGALLDWFGGSWHSIGTWNPFRNWQFRKCVYWVQGSQSWKVRDMVWMFYYMSSNDM